MREDWVEIELGELCKFSQGVQVAKGEQYAEKNKNRVRFLRIIDFTQGKDEPRYIDRPNEINIVAKDDISMVRYGTVGFVCSGIEGAIANNLFRIIPNIDIDKKYLINFLNSVTFKSQINAKGATMQALNFGLIKPIKVSLAPLLIQKAIVKKIEELFSSLDSGIADLIKAQDQLVIYRQAVLKKAFEGELTKEWRAKQTNLPSADELLEQIKEERQKHYEKQLADWKEAVKVWEANGKVGKKPKKPVKIKDLPSLSKNEIELEITIPRNWTYEKIGNITDSIVPNRDKPKSFNGDIHWLTTPDLNLNSIKIDYNSIEKGLTKEECSNYNARIIPINSVIMTCVGMLGTSSIIEQEVVINQQLHAFTPSNSYIPKYLAYLIRFNKSYLERSSAATTVQYLNKTKCNSIPFPLCSKEEQQQIVSDIESRLSVCDKVEKDIADSLQKAQALRQSILKKAFEGTLLSEEEIAKCKADTNYEPASVLLEKIKKEKKK